MSKSVATYAQAQCPPEAMLSKQTELGPKLPVITIVPDANPVRPVARRGPAAAASRRRELNSTSTWNASFCDCCCAVAPTYCCVVTCCPCTTVASVKESLGGGYEGTLVYFGALAFGVLFCIGFAASNNSNDSPDFDMASTPPPAHHHDGLCSSALWEAAALAFFMTFLFGVWRLRVQTRHALGIQGSPAVDCLSSFFCCFCVISQLHLELKCHYEEPSTTRTPQCCHERGDENFAAPRRMDTLAPYAVM
ncbi:PLAC8 family protein [Phytophthora cinnamomi]|uniref:PLAC8 family protein n=1 Tax=Phytophthora cinnamomi TaxID=4785 RepID=UPI00355A5138|nr:PLAC8 family protein [Phytophthora cinnamomi]